MRVFLFTLEACDQVDLMHFIFIQYVLLCCHQYCIYARTHWKQKKPSVCSIQTIHSSTHGCGVEWLRDCACEDTFYLQQHIIIHYILALAPFVSLELCNLHGKACVCARKCCSSCTGHTRSTVSCHAMPYMPTHSPRTTAEMP